MEPKLSVAEFTVYEVLGYLVPGLALAGWTLLVFSGDQWVKHPFPEGVQPSVLVGVGCYVLGHLVQAVGNLLPRVLSEGTLEDLGMTPGVTAKVKGCIRKAFGVDQTDGSDVFADQTDGSDVFALCDAYLQRVGHFAERDVLTYREGFYRGMVVVAAVALGESIGGYVTGNGLGLGSRQLGLGEAIGVWLGLVAACAFFYQRYARFRGYRLRGVYLAFCDSVLSSGTPQSPTKANSG